MYEILLIYCRNKYLMLDWDSVSFHSFVGGSRRKKNYLRNKKTEAINWARE